MANSGNHVNIDINDVAHRSALSVIEKSVMTRHLLHSHKSANLHIRTCPNETLDEAVLPGNWRKLNHSRDRRKFVVESRRLGIEILKSNLALFISGVLADTR